MPRWPIKSRVVGIRVRAAHVHDQWFHSVCARAYPQWPTVHAFHPSMHTPRLIMTTIVLTSCMLPEVITGRSPHACARPMSNKGHGSNNARPVGNHLRSESEAGAAQGEARRGGGGTHTPACLRRSDEGCRPTALLPMVDASTACPMPGNLSI